MMYDKNDIKITLSPEEREETEKIVMATPPGFKMPAFPKKGDLVTASGVGVGVVIDEMYGTDLIRVSWFTQGIFGFAPYTVTEDHRTTVSVLSKAT